MYSHEAMQNVLIKIKNYAENTASFTVLLGLGLLQFSDWWTMIL